MQCWTSKYTSLLKLMDINQCIFYLVNCSLEAKKNFLKKKFWNWQIYSDAFMHISAMLSHTTCVENLFVTSVNKSGGWMDYLSQAVKSSAAVFSTQAAEVLSQDRDFAHAHLPSSGCRRFSVIIKYFSTDSLLYF